MYSSPLLFVILIFKICGNSEHIKGDIQEYKQWAYTTLICEWGADRKFCSKGHCLASRGFAICTEHSCLILFLAYLSISNVSF